MEVGEGWHGSQALPLEYVSWEVHKVSAVESSRFEFVHDIRDMLCMEQISQMLL